MTRLLVCACEKVRERLWAGEKGEREEERERENVRVCKSQFLESVQQKRKSKLFCRKTVLNQFLLHFLTLNGQIKVSIFLACVKKCKLIILTFL